MIFVFFFFQAGLAISKLCEVLGDTLSPRHHVLLASLMKEIPGRLWEVHYFLLILIQVQ